MRARSGVCGGSLMVKPFIQSHSALLLVWTSLLMLNNFRNNKPWTTIKVKYLLNLKKKAFKDGDQAELKRIQKRLQISLGQARKKSEEKKLQENNTSEVWDGMKNIRGCYR